MVRKVSMMSPHRRSGLHQLDRYRHDVLRGIFGDGQQLLQELFHLHGIAFAAHALRAIDLSFRGRLVVGMDVNLRVGLPVDKAVDADDGLVAGLLAQRGLVGKVGDVPLEPAILNELERATALLDLIENLENALFVVGRQRLEEVGAADGIGDLRNVGLFGDDLLGPQRHPHRVFGRDRECLVVTIGVQRLAAHRAPRRAPVSSCARH